jgi:hypothetical protein
MENIPFDNEFYNEKEKFVVMIFGGERSAQFAQFLFYKAKKMLVSPNSIPEHTLATIARAIEV